MIKFNENDKSRSNSHIYIEVRFEPFSYFCSIFRVIIFAQNLASHVGIINSFADISFVLREDFVLCQDKIWTNRPQTKYEKQDYIE